MPAPHLKKNNNDNPNWVLWNLQLTTRNFVRTGGYNIADVLNSAFMRGKKYMLSFMCKLKTNNVYIFSTVD